MPAIRPSNAYMDSILGKAHKVLDHGVIRAVDYMGNEAAIVQAARVSYGQGTDTPAKDTALLRYLMRHWHTTPFEMAEVKLHLKMPIFVARQWIRHRTANINEISGRYTTLPTEFYVPRLEDMARQSKDNKQGRGDHLSMEEAIDAAVVMGQAGTAGFAAYNTLMDTFDMAKELARTTLPLSTYTEFYWKIDLHNLLHFLRLRTDSHAQYEIRVYADAIWMMVESWMPTVAEAFRDYRLESVTFSATEMQAIRAVFDASNPFYVRKELDALKEQISAREFDVFLNSLQGRTKA